MPRHVGVTMQKHIDLPGRTFRRDMLEPKTQAGPFQIHHQGPLGNRIAIASHHRHARAQAAQFIQDRFRADVSQMPDLIRIFRQGPDIFRETVVGVS